jgi:hypothetical protein
VPETSLLEASEHGVEQERLRIAFDESRAELPEHGKIKASVFSFKAKSILPIQMSTHGMSRLPIG